MTDSNRTDSTDTCPLGHRCESCGAPGPALTVVVHDVSGLCFCTTSCPRCKASGEPPGIALRTAIKLASEHEQHVAPRRERVLRRAR